MDIYKEKQKLVVVSKILFQCIYYSHLWKSGGYIGFALSEILWFCHSVIIQMKLEYLWGQLANVDQILYEALLGWGKGCIRFWDKLDQNSGFHGNRKRTLTYNGENDVSFCFFLHFLFLQFSNIKIFRHTFIIGTVRPRRLKLGTHVDSGWMYGVYQNQAAAAYAPLYFLFFLSPIFKY